MASPEKLKEIKDDYLSSLSDLTINSKPLINMLTMLAEDNIDNSVVIVQAIEEHLAKVPSKHKLPVLYLIDSIVKNVGNAYTTLFTQNIVSNFCGVFEKVDEGIRAQMFKLRQTWSDVFPLKKLYALDVRVNNIDPAWPIIAPTPTPSIHVNPKFFNKAPVTTSTATPTVTTSTTSTLVSPTVSTLDPKNLDMLLIAKQKQLIELQQRKVELELLQAKVKLEEQQKKQLQSNQIKTTPSVVLPSMKTVLTKPTALQVDTKPAEIKSVPVIKMAAPKLPPQIVPPVFGSKVAVNAGPRIAPVNSALVAAATKAAPRTDPRLASKARQASALNEVETPKTTNPPAVSDRRTAKHKSNRTIAESVGCDSNNDNSSNDKNVFNKIGAIQNNASSATDPRLLSNKVHGPTAPSASSDAPGRRPKRKSAQARTKTDSATNALPPVRRTGASSPDGPSDDIHRSSSRSPVKPKRKEPRDSTRERSETKRSDRSKNASPPSPSPSVTEVVEARSPKTPTRNRDRSRRERSPEQRRDIDLRIGAPPEKQARVRSPVEDENKTRQVIDASTINKDVDLRQYPPPIPPTVSGKKRTSNDGSEQPSAKKNKAEIFDALFGNEDVDLRTMTAVPPPAPRPPTPPPPIISSSAVPGVDDKENGGWAKVKETKSPVTPGPNTHLATVRAKLANATNRDRLGRPLLYKRTHDEPLFKRGFEPKISDDASLKVIFAQAEEEHKNGKISTQQFQILMQQVIRLIETQKLREAQRKEAKSSGSIVDGNLQPISDDELSADFSEDDDDNEMRPMTVNEEANKETHPVSTRSDNQLPSPRLTNRSSSPRLERRSSSPRSDHRSGSPRPDHRSSSPRSDHRSSSPRSERRSSSPRQEHRSSSPRPEHRSSSPRPEHRSGSPRSDNRPSSPKKLEQPPRAFDANNFQARPRKPRTRPITRRWDAPAAPPPVWDPPRPPVVVTLPSQIARPSPWARPPINAVDDKDRFNSSTWQPPGGFIPPRMPLARPPVSTNSVVDARPNVACGGFVRNPPVPHYDPSASPPAIGCHATKELPQADPSVLDYINDDVMKTINIDGIPREIRYYGETAIVIMSWDDTREISFQAGQRRVTFDEKESYLLSFNDTYRDVMIAGSPHKIRLGGPTRELYIDDKWYECFFGGPGIGVEIDGKIRVVKMEGPPPQVKIGSTKRTDLCAGRINLIVDARTMVPIFLDAKPQKFDIEGKIHTLRFVDALKTVLINEVPFKVEFGGLPKPIKVHDKKHFIRFSVLPKFVRPGYVDIKDMEGRKVAVSPPRVEPESVIVPEVVLNKIETNLSVPPPPSLEVAAVADTNEPVLPMVGKRRIPPVDLTDNRSNSPTPNAIQKPNIFSGLDVLSSLIPTAMAPSSNINSSGYQVEPVEPAVTTTTSTQPTGIPGLETLSRPAPTLGLPSTIDIDDLFRKLVATGIVSNLVETKTVKENKTDESKNAMKTVLFEKPETLKVKQPTIVTALYSGMQCSSCGVRFPPEHTMKYSQHLDWHFRQNRRERHSVRKANSRKWFYDVSDWIQFEEIEDLEEREKNWFESQQLANAAGEAAAEEPTEEVEIPSVEAGGTGQNARCDVCHDSFDQFYNEDKEEWHLKMAMRVDGKLYHPLCYKDYKALTEDVSVTDTTLNDSTENKPIKEGSEAETDLTENESGSVTELETKVEEDVLKSETEIKNDEKSLKDDNVDSEEDASDAVIEIPEKEIESITIEDDDTPIEVKEEPLVFDLTAVIVKTEPIDPDTSEEYPIVDDDDNALQSSFKTESIYQEDPITTAAADTTRAAVVSSIDGNVQMEASTPAVSVPGGKIKINISKPISSQKDSDKQVDQPVEKSTDGAESTQSGEATTDEAPIQVKLKPAFEGKVLKVLDPVQKGNELSGLCSIM